MIKPSHPGDDFNDVLKKEGMKAVQEYVKPYHDPSLQTIQEEFKVKEAKSIPTNTPKASEPDLKAVSSHPLETVYTYIESKLKEMKTFEGSFLADQAKKELETYITILEKDQTRMQDLRNFNPELAKELETYIHNQNRCKSLGKGR